MIDLSKLTDEYQLLLIPFGDKWSCEIKRYKDGVVFAAITENPNNAVRYALMKANLYKG